MVSASAKNQREVRDSVLGRDVNLDAGTKISNLKMTGDAVVLNIKGESHTTGIRKFGALVGDGSETGCNSVLNPGVLLGKECMVYPVANVRKAYYEAGSRIKK